MKRLFFLLMMICAYLATYAQNLTVKAAEANNISFTILTGISDDSIKSNDFDSADLCHRQVILDYIEYIRTAYALKDIDSADFCHRQVILDYIEQLRTAYAQKDIDFLNQVFCDNDSVLGNEISSIHYMKNSKKQYIKNLRRAFQREDHFKAHFNDIKVIRHPIETDFYGVTVLHGWTSDNYHDEGYLFMLWDFTDENAPKILVCTWQPSMINGKPLPKDEIIGLHNFDI